jgi:hypothetical protein
MAQIRAATEGEVISGVVQRIAHAIAAGVGVEVDGLLDDPA